MKLSKLMVGSALSALTLAPSFALAHGSKMDAVTNGVAAALAVFERDERDPVKSAFAGVKAWLEGKDIRVKVYLSGQPELRYVCKGHDDLVCEKAK